MKVTGRPLRDLVNKLLQEKSNDYARIGLRRRLSRHWAVLDTALRSDKWVRFLEKYKLTDCWQIIVFSGYKGKRNSLSLVRRGSRPTGMRFQCSFKIQTFWAPSLKTMIYVGSSLKWWKFKKKSPKFRSIIFLCSWPFKEVQAFCWLQKLSEVFDLSSIVLFEMNDALFVDITSGTGAEEQCHGLSFKLQVAFGSYYRPVDSIY